MNTPVDALLLLSFGGPEKPEDVMPFLRNVTRGRGIPDSRLEEVAVHYHHFDGYSPLNDCNREIISNIETELGLRGISLPIYFGNRNWAPYASDVALEIAHAGHKKVAVFATSAWGGYSGCRQYAEDIALMLETLTAHNAGHVDFYRLRQFFDHPEFIEGNVHAINDAYQAFSRQGINKDEIRLVFTAHSIPVIADTSSGTAEDGPLYSRQVKESARLVAEQLGVTDYDVVWQSASGDGKVPWLDPDIVDHARELHAQGVNNLVVCSIGFISDHMEVVWDLDNELQEVAEEMGIKVVRAATVGHTKEFASMVVDLVFETFGHQPPLHLGTVPSKGCTVNGSPCEVDCCQPAKRPHSITA